MIYQFHPKELEKLILRRTQSSAIKIDSRWVCDYLGGLDDVSGAYFNDFVVYDSTPFPTDPKNAEILWRLCEQMVEEKFDW